MEEGGGENEEKIESEPLTDLNKDDNSSKKDSPLNESSLSESTPEVVSDDKSKEDNGEKKERKHPEEKLSGWLTPRPKVMGPLKILRQRWFQFGDDNCKLYCYKTPQDLVPLFEIGIVTASFDFDAANQESPGLFKIKSEGKEYLLDAGSRQNMFHWLQSLQMKRREFNLSRVFVSNDRVGHWSMKRTSNIGGLLSKDSASAVTGMEYEPVADITSDLPEIHVPESDVHSSNSSLNSQPAGPPPANRPMLWPLNTLKTELTQKWSGLKLPGRLNRNSQTKDQTDSVFYCDLKNHDSAKSNDQLSVSTTSINSNDSLAYSEPSHYDSEPFLNGKTRTGSHLSHISDVSEETDPKDNLLTLRRHLGHSDCDSTLTARDAGSWAIVTQKDVASLVVKEMEKQSVSSQPLASLQHEQGQSSYQGQTSAIQGQPIKEAGKSGGLMSKFSSLKKISIGRNKSLEQAQVSKTQSVTAASSQPKSDSDSGRDGGSDGSAKDATDLEQELKANREIISILQQKLLEISRETQTREAAGSASEEEKTAMLVERDRQILDLQTELDLLKQECHNREEQFKNVESELQSSQDQVAMYCDMLKAKDEVVTSLSNQIYQSEQQRSEVMPRSSSFDQPDVVQSMLSRESSGSLCAIDRNELRELERYKDMCQGYELQHKFLAKEVLELNDLRKDDMAREKKLMMDFAKMQAKYYQIKSKYFVLLKEQREQNPHREGEDGQEVVSQLLQDALEVDTDDLELRLTGSAEEYDRYGFSRKHYMEVNNDSEEEDPLANKAAELERRHEVLSTKVKDADRDASLRVKWENYMVGRGGKLQKCQELKMLIRQGVPHEYREEVWKGCINFFVGEKRASLDLDYYQTLLQRKAVAQGSDPAVKQIELDLLRTLPNNKHYESIDSEGVVKLRRVLLAFSEYNRVIGYCQGLNRLAAIALLFLNEEDAFWCLVAIVDYILPPEYFSTTLMAAQADQRVLKDLVKEKLPAVHQKLEINQVDLALFTFNWFLTVFVDNIPTDMFLRIWDTFLFEGSKVLFRFAAAFLKKAEPEILRQKDGLELNRYLRKIGENMTNVQLICHYAFDWINPFPMRFLANRRQHHIQLIKGELAELDKIRRGIRAERASTTILEYYSDDDLES